MWQTIIKILNRFEKFQLPVIVLVAFVLRIPQMCRGLHYDELNTIYYFVQSHDLLASMNDILFTSQLAYPILNYAFCHLFGVSEWSVRFPALLFGLGSIVLIWFFCKKYFSNLTAFLSASFFAFSPVHIIWSTTGRGYSAMIFLSLASTYLYFSLLQKPSLKTALILIITNVLGFFFHLFFICVIGAQILHFLWVFFSVRDFSKKGDRGWLGFIATGGSFILSLLTHGAGGLANVTHYSQATPFYVDPLINFPGKLWSDYLSLDLWPYGIAALLLMIFGLITVNKKLLHWRGYVFLLFLCSFLIWLLKPRFVCTRYLAFLFPFIFLLISNGLTYIIKALPIRLRTYTVALFIGLFTLIEWNWISKPSALVIEYQHEYKKAITFAESISNNETAFCAFGNRDEFFQYYSKRPVVRFKTFDDFRSFYQTHGSILCFAMMGPPMSEEHRKIFLFLYLNKVGAVNFGNIIVFHLKG